MARRQRQQRYRRTPSRSAGAHREHIATRYMYSYFDLKTRVWARDDQRCSREDDLDPLCRRDRGHHVRHHRRSAV
jgi:hypothetical protein